MNTVQPSHEPKHPKKHKELAQAKAKTKENKKNKAYWMKQLHLWHWVSSAMCLIAMLGFAITGMTLNHASDIEANPVVTKKIEKLPDAYAVLLNVEAQKIVGSENTGKAAVLPELPKEVKGWLKQTFDIALPTQHEKNMEWNEGGIYIALPQPGGDAWLSIDRQTNQVEYEHTSRGVVSFLNDLHKGRHTSSAWKLFLDVFSVACLVFCITGLFLLKIHAKNRPSTWPLVVAGLLIPFVVASVWAH